ncbi:hypothetical protein [Sphingomonas sp. R86521]|uniref:hypothetical protein n=1 Tax=Sphingomonas sp. R86521 TaxID=3093860 RepID=UPI0036D2AF05
MITETRSIHAEGDALDLNPFAFWPAYTSRLEPLGGKEPCEDPDYVFHTLYAACGDGPIAVTVTVSDLAAERGTMILRIHELPDGVGSNARQIAIKQVQLVDLIRGDGTAMISALARHGHTYAALGHIYGDTIATASDLQVRIERRMPDPNAADIPSEFISSRVGVVPLIVGTAPPSMTGPVSQMCSAPQFRERAYADWAAYLGGARGKASLSQWQRVFIARTLDRYDMARPGARGLAIGGLDEPQLVAVLTASGCMIDTSVRTSGVASAERLIVLDPEAMPESVNGYDFVFATREQGIGGTWKDRLAYIESVLRCLKPGGLAIVMADAIIDDDAPAGSDVLAWHDIVRMGLVLLSRGHQLAQLRRDIRHPYAEANDAQIEQSAFGFVVRRR